MRAPNFWKHKGIVARLLAPLGSLHGLSIAFKAASDAPGIRTELVDRMRDKLNAGKVGNDAGALADAIIDDLAK